MCRRVPIYSVLGIYVCLQKVRAADSLHNPAVRETNSSSRDRVYNAAAVNRDALFFSSPPSPFDGCMREPFVGGIRKTGRRAPGECSAAEGGGAGETRSRETTRKKNRPAKQGCLLDTVHPAVQMHRIV